MTVGGYTLLDCASAMQKAIRRADARVAGFFALELWHSNYKDYVWRRLLTISAEDCYGLITYEINALMEAHDIIRKQNKDKGRIFVSKAVLLLCSVKKNRDADHLQNLIYDRKDVDVEKWIEDVRKDPISIPEYTFDCHTKKGKKAGRTKAEFFRDELDALQPRIPGLFDNLVPEKEQNLFES